MNCDPRYSADMPVITSQKSSIPVSTRRELNLNDEKSDVDEITVRLTLGEEITSHGHEFAGQNLILTGSRYCNYVN